MVHLACLIVVLLTVLGCNDVISVAGLCEPFQCGKSEPKFSYPFWSLAESKNTFGYCGYEGFGVNCSNGKAILTVADRQYLVRSINYTAKTLVVADVELMGETCTSLDNMFSDTRYFEYGLNNIYIQLLRNCPDSVTNFSCLDSNTNTTISYFLEVYAPNRDNWSNSCEERKKVPIFNKAKPVDISSYVSPSRFQGGFQLAWNYNKDGCYGCEQSGGRCGYHESKSASVCICSTNTISFQPNCTVYQGMATRTIKKKTRNAETGRLRTKIIIGVLTGVGSLILIILYASRRNRFRLICEWSNKRRNSSNVDVFLENYGPLALHRYMYSDIKKITNSFRDKLGKGGYGTVFKGMLKDGSLVAVKVLNESKDNGEEFINEVATIGKTNHINIVGLVGFCAEGSKRALVYELMPNGSLEKFIYDQKGTSKTHPLGSEKLYQIALGIANGLEYLHRGCKTRILHFDIKPHNILLDTDFCPKISDFGLAKPCRTRDDVVSMLNARGTLGYIAPEVYQRNLGGVSSKSDVYSYGMMLMEMVGGRRNIDVTVENTSEIYFPQWIYKHLNQQKNIGSDEYEKYFGEECIKKMIIVGLWCIQTHPPNRPSMSMVVDMLQGNVEDLRLPPNPFLEPPSTSHSSS